MPTSKFPFPSLNLLNSSARSNNHTNYMQAMQRMRSLALGDPLSACIFCCCAHKISMMWICMYFRTIRSRHMLSMSNKIAKDWESFSRKSRSMYRKVHMAIWGALLFHFVPGDTQNPSCLSRRNRSATSWRQALLNSAPWMLVKTERIWLLKWWSILRCWSVSTKLSSSTVVVQASNSPLIFSFSWFTLSVVHSSDFYIHREIPLLWGS
jgi:hypothetical protein